MERDRFGSRTITGVQRYGRERTRQAGLALSTPAP